MTRTIGYPYLGIMLISLLGLSSCYELQSDEELREDIIGQWKMEDCPLAFSDSKDVTGSSVLMQEMTFRSDGSIIEAGLYPYCCDMDCDTSKQGPCTWAIEDGQLTITPSGSSIPSIANEYVNLNRALPILYLQGDRLVCDNIVISGFETTKTCCCRQ